MTDPHDGALTLSTLVKTRRRELKLSMSGMATAGGFTKQYVCMLESGVAENPRASHIRMIADALLLKPEVVLAAALGSQDGANV